MIDKPRGTVEGLLEKTMKWVSVKSAQIKKKISPVTHVLNFQKTSHPILAKLVIATICLFGCGLIIAGYAMPKTVHVNIDDSIEVVSTDYDTTAVRVDYFLENHQIDYDYGKDLIDVELFSGITEGMEINIVKQFPVKVLYCGETYTYYTLPATVQDVLDGLGIRVGDDDIVTPSVDSPVYKDMEILIQEIRVSYVTETVETDFEVHYVADNSLNIGETKVKQKGRKGIYEKTILTVSIDGEEVSRTIMETKQIKKKKDKIILYGTKISKGVPADLKYKQKLTHVRAISYHYSGSPRGVYGLKCEYGTCAVDRNVIPLGSLLYIEGYGYAIANDVGSSIKGKTVDLYMERLSQCGIWGARWTNVYIVEYGDNSRYWE